MAVSRIEPIVASDRAEWLALWQDYLTFYEEDLDPATSEVTWARLLSPDSDMHGAVARADDGSSIGIVHWLTHHSTWSTTTYCYLEDLFVSPAVRGGGVGRSLIEHVRDWAEANGCDKAYWLTAETNTRAQALYNAVATRTGFIHYEIELRA